MAGMPPDSRYVTATVPAEMKAGAEITDGVEVAAPTSAIAADGVEERITQIRFPRPAHIPAGAPKLGPVDDGGAVLLPRPAGTELRYDFALLPGVQCRIQLIGDATADHIEQLVAYLTVACEKIREQEARQPRKPERVKINADHETTTRRKKKEPQAPAGGEPE